MVTSELDSTCGISGRVKRDPVSARARNWIRQ